MSARAAGTVRAVLFDVDDTLVPWQTVAHWQWAWKPQGPRLAERHVLAGIHRALHAWDRRRWQGLVGEAPPADAAAYTHHVGDTLDRLSGHPLPDVERDAVVRRFLKPAGEIESYPEVAALLERLAAEGVGVAAVTGMPRDAAETALRRAGLVGVRLVAAAAPDAPALPAPVAFRAAAAAFGVKPREALYVGDLFWSDVRAAARVGFATALLDRRDWAGNVLARRIRTLREVPELLAGGPPPAPPDAGTGRLGPGGGPPGP